MNKALMAELEKLGPDERLRLAYDLLDSVVQAESAAPVTEAQRAELRRRLDEYQLSQSEPWRTYAGNLAPIDGMALLVVYRQAARREIVNVARTYEGHVKA